MASEMALKQKMAERVMQEVAKVSRPAATRLVEQPMELTDIQKQLEAALSQRYQMASGVSREGNEIRVPKFMTLKDAAEAITSFEEEQETEEDTLVELFGHPYDCANAFHRAVSEVYGQMISSTNYGFFGMPMNGRTLSVPTSWNSSIVIPIGNAKVPSLPIQLNINVTDPSEWRPGQHGGFIKFTTKRMYKPLLDDIEARAKAILRKESIFRGQAIDSKYKFIRVDNFDRSRVIYSDEQMRQLQANIFTLIQEKQRAIAANIPIKRGVLLHGPYGTGKTLTALYTGSLCVEHDWTFILVRPEDEISDAISLAQQLQPAVVFFEDIDAVALEERDEDVNTILNTIDGVLSKDSEVMVILTTNHIEKVNPAMLRPGRLDAVIKLGALDGNGVIRFINSCLLDATGQHMLDGNLDEKGIIEAADGYTPAFLKEAVSKATLYAISRGAYNGKSAHICSADIVSALHELRPQFEMMAGPRESTKKPRLLEELGQLIDKFVTDSEERICDAHDRLHDYGNLQDHVDDETMREGYSGQA